MRTYTFSHIRMEDHASVALETILREFSGTPQFSTFMGMAAAQCEELTRKWLVEVAAPTRHTTAERLGVSPTSYLEKRSRGIESSVSGMTAFVTLGGAPEIFARAFGAVTIRPKLAEWLTIPITAEAHARRAREIEGLFFVRSRRNAAHGFLARRDGEGLKFFYSLRKEVTLPQDEGLLPDAQAYREAVNLAAQDYIEREMYLL